jgi:copper chaperone
MAEKVYTVTGMTCSCCVNSVSTAVNKVSGISDVNVDLDTGQLIVTGDQFADEQVRAAVGEAGYALADA